MLRLLLPKRKLPVGTLVDLRFRTALANFLKVLAALAVVLFVLVQANIHKGYWVTKLDGVDNSYKISVELNRERAQTYYDWMIKNQTEICVARDVCLPNGVLTVATVSLEEVVDFLQSDAKTARFSTVWSAEEHTRTQVSEEDNRVTVFIWMDYKTLLETMKEAEADPTGKCMLRQDIVLPNGRNGCCFLGLNEMENYRCRMRTQGANWIVIPMYYNLDGVSPILNIPVADRLV